jgi:hypothetical protein
VEWWCLEKELATLMTRRFADDPDLAGEIVAVYKPL